MESPNYSKFKAMSPPPPNSVERKTASRSSHALAGMMTSGTNRHPRRVSSSATMAGSTEIRQLLLQERVADILSIGGAGSTFGEEGTADVRLTLTSNDGMAVSFGVHRRILVANSRFFAGTFSGRWSREQRSLPHLVDISDCDDVEAYAETLCLMYCKDIRRRLMSDNIAKVLGILKASAAIMFDMGVLSCLEYLEAAPWAGEDDEKVASLLSDLRLTESSSAREVLKRVAPECSGSGTCIKGYAAREEVLLRLVQVVIEGKDDKARREMKGFVAKLLRENNAPARRSSGGSNEWIYSACENCLQHLKSCFLLAADGDMTMATQIARQADNLRWILEILVERQIAEYFLTAWARQNELSEAHPKVPAVHRFEVSRVTARLFVGMGKGQILVSAKARIALLSTWLEPFYEDFGWMKRACKGLDRHSVEDGLANTILTLPLPAQQKLLLAWLDRFLNSGQDCPNVHKGFEVWWRRTFRRRFGDSLHTTTGHHRITAATAHTCCK